MNGAALVFEGVRVRYAGSDREALRGIDFDVGAGEFVALGGASGGGKSTLRRTGNRMVAPSAGRGGLDGTDVATQDPVALRRGIGYAIQAVGLFTHMTVAQNVAVVPQLLGWDERRIAARVDELLDLVQLEPQRYRARRPRDLSGGEAQRVGVARALAGEPRALLMDEPFGAVDAIVRADLQRALAQIVRRLGVTTLFVTHDVNEARRLADRICVMNEGAVEQIASPGTIEEAPATPYVRRLVESALA